MSNAQVTAIVVASVCGGLLCGGIGGYFLGLFHSKLVDKIRTLEQSRVEQKPIEPQVTMGAYTPPQFVPQDDERPVGVIESKTPERVAFETEQAIENEGRSIKAQTHGLH